MTLVVDAGGVRGLAGNLPRLKVLADRGLMPASLPTVVLTDCLTGDHRRDYHVNRLLRACLLVVVDELLARDAARLRTETGRAGDISSVDALVVAVASTLPEPIILTSDPDDITALAEHAGKPIRIAAT